MNEMLKGLGERAREAEVSVRNLSTDKKNQVLLAVADKLVAQGDVLLKANAIDVENGKANGMPSGLVDRLLLTKERISGPHRGSDRNEKKAQRTAHRTKACAFRRHRHHL